MIAGAAPMRVTVKSGMMQFVAEYHFISKFKFACLIVCALVTQTGCLGTYLVKSGYGQMKLLSSREDIDEVLGDPKISPDVKQKLNLAVQTRKFAVERLGLKASKHVRAMIAVTDGRIKLREIVFGLSQHIGHVLDPLKRVWAVNCHRHLRLKRIGGN